MWKIGRSVVRTEWTQLQQETKVPTATPVQAPRQAQGRNMGQTNVSADANDEHSRDNTIGGEVVKGRRRLKREQKERERREMLRRNRKRQRIVCDLEGEGPCMFCGRDVIEKRDMPEWQMRFREILEGSSASTAHGGDGDGKKKKSKAQKDVPGLTRSVPFSMKAGGGKGVTADTEDMWVPLGVEPQYTPAAVESGAMPMVPFNDLPAQDQEATLQRAFEDLGLANADDTTAKRARAWWDAMRRKQRLLEYDRTAAQRSKLIDESADFDIDKAKRWMSAEERALAEQTLERRRQQEAEFEDRRRRGVRVLRLDLDKHTAYLERERYADSYDELAAVLYPPPTERGSRKAMAEARVADNTGKGSGDFAQNPYLAASNAEVGEDGAEVWMPKFVSALLAGPITQDGIGHKSDRLTRREEQQQQQQQQSQAAMLQRNLRVQYLTADEESDGAPGRKSTASTLVANEIF
ncbi:hypothetical protein EV182_002218 [Spiromyces aspiralis]|uniref:Uncharacterized protein n=1 Tax=Spiromyces aspiralis TaxID=68401 RepID=A0ACC1HSD4_9FUNG|nr:hypothetical protein EV182_002218 [Spiromyces aspiralis]